MSTIFRRALSTIRRPRLLISILFGALCFGLLRTQFDPNRAALLAFDIAAFSYIALMFELMRNGSTHAIKNQAKRLSENKWVILFSSMCIAVVVVLALFYELGAAKAKSFDTIALAGVSIFLAWVFVAMIFAQQYAYDFYLEPGQLSFPNTPEPNFWDFAYLSFVLSMCCQTSDVMVNSSAMRKLVMLHSVLSFFFNLIIIAIAVSVAASAL